MKLRIRGNSIRLRLTQAEVKSVREGELVQESIEFAKGARLHYVLEPSSKVSAIEARFIDHRVSVLVPMEMAVAWATSETIELKSNQPLESEMSTQSAGGDSGVADKKERGLFILIEKDFVCLKARTNESENETDMFPNPNAAHGTCGGHHHG